MALVDLLGDDLLIFGLCDDEIGYIVPPNDFLLHEKMPYIEKAIDPYGRRHYEETNSAGSSAAWAIARAVALLADETDH